jgi:hypothetical protein
MNAKTTRFFDPATLRKWLLRGFYGVCSLLVIADLLSHGHSQHAWEKLPAFYGIYGLLVCLVLAVMAKLIAKLIKAKEDYYDV